MSIRLGIGKSDFEKLREGNFCYIDKTEILYDLLQKEPEVALLTRPRRFGKTLMMSMMENFFNIKKDSKEIFAGLNIMNHPQICEEYMNQYPVIFLSFKGASGETFEVAYNRFKSIISEFCSSISDIVDDKRIRPTYREKFRKLEEETASYEEVSKCLSTLMYIMHTVYGKQVIVLIDEYDVPIAKAYDKDPDMKDYYPSMLDLIRNLLESSLKDNTALKFGVLTGCLRVSKESIFTGLNNPAVYTILDKPFSSYFGFLEEEVQSMLNNIGCVDKLSTIREWYDGYIFGDNHMYCPWDVINYVSDLQDDRDTLPKNYWQNTSGNDIVSIFIKEANLNTRRDLQNLLNGTTVQKTLVNNINYGMANSDIENLYTLLFHTGYLTKATTTSEIKNITLKIPNREIADLFESEVVSHFRNTLTSKLPTSFVQSLWDGNTDAASTILTKLLSQTISYHDYCESYYHAFLTGLLAKIDTYEVLSNRETGKGRADIVIKDIDNHRAIIIEAKFTKNEKEIDKLCDKAIAQINEKKYESEIRRRTYPEVTSFGVVFFEKCAVIKMKPKD